MMACNSVNCRGCNWTMLQFCSMCNSIELLINFLVRHHVILGCCWCERCGQVCRLDFRCFSFRCDRRHVRFDSRGRCRTWRCNYKRSLFLGTWFSGVHLSVVTICKFNCLWLILPFPRQNFIQTELGISRNTVVDWSSFCREVCVYWLGKCSQVLGCPGVVVEIDEAKFGKQKFNTDGVIDATWVFGGFERGSKNCFLVQVPSRGSDVLLDVIKTWIRPGTTVISDCWKAYDCLSTEGFVHQSVNHSMIFVDPHSGAHTQNIKRIWREVRGGIPRFGRTKNHMAGYLAEFLFKRKYSAYTERIHAFFSMVAQLYSPALQQSQ